MKKTRRKRQNNNKTSKRIKIINNNIIYNDNDYSSGDGFLTSVWGPTIWFFLHTISFNYPVNPTTEDKRNYRDFILNMKNVLPCKHCRENLKKNMQTAPLTMDHMKNRYTFSLYMYNLHEIINEMLNKKSGLTYEDVRERFEHFRARDCDKIDKTNKEKGCFNPLYGKKSKCIIKIVPQETKTASFQLDKKCIKIRMKNH